MTTQRVKSSKKNNKKIGGEFEAKICKNLATAGFWVHFMHPAPDGSQPFDIIAIGYDDEADKPIIIAVDCKTLDSKRFPLDRIEYNQETSFALLNSKGIDQTYFAIEVTPTGEFFMIPSQMLIKEKHSGKASVRMEEYEGYRAGFCKQ